MAHRGVKLIPRQPPRHTRERAKKMTTKVITYQDWIDTYNIKKNEHGEIIATFDTHGQDWDYVKLLDPVNVWTFFDENGKGVITNGIGWINRLEYYTSETPWKEGEVIEVRW